MVSNIWVAAADNQIQIVESYLNAGSFTSNSQDPNGYTPIHAAASYGHIGLLKKLIEKGGNINIQDNEGDTPLHHVEDIKTAQFIINELKGDYKIKNNDGQIAADYIEEEDEFPELAQYLKSLAHDKPQDLDNDLAQQNEFLQSLPQPGTIDGHEIRYTLEDDATPSSTDADPLDEEERRRRIETILNSENPEEALRDLVTSAVKEGFANFNQDQQQEQQDQEQHGSSKKRRE